ncbi:Cyclin d3 [Melia azedarach]|uniref:Cyclin d3 n=1 Tax=Melia azedarach TaxID=155640 RepID=A0ACC1XYE0_MELAZ|nr:Cyclin d3 [Melia azedarach]
MAILQQQQFQDEEENPSSFLIDELYCEEEELDDDDEVLQGEEYGESCNAKNPSFFPFLLLEQDLFWEDEELLSLFSKEQQQQTHFSVRCMGIDKDSFLAVARSEVVERILKVNARYGFTTLTAVLAINYLDRFICTFHFQRDQPWMIQLLAVTCLSLAAKVEETQVPIFLDLQAEETKYVFEAKAIQRMELLILSTLQWKMHLVTPISFLDHIIRRLGLKTTLHWEFLHRCERLLLTVVSDPRSVSYLPSVLATATMMHVIDQVEPLNPIDYKNQLLGVLKISKDKVSECYKLILEQSNTNEIPRKRKYESIPGSPGGVIDAAVFSCEESSNDSWVVGPSTSTSSSSVLSASAAEPLFKKSRVLNRVIVGSPS